MGQDLVRVTWRQFGGIVWLCTLVGILVGSPLYLLGWPGVPWPYLPIILIVACVVAGAFALVAAVYASIVLILVARFAPPRKRSMGSTVMLGILLGALAGALHPILIVWIVVGGLSVDGPIALGGLRLALMVTVCGAVAGGLVVRRYGPPISPAV